jgi:hypothetical protein
VNARAATPELVDVDSIKVDLKELGYLFSHGNHAGGVIDAFLKNAVEHAAREFRLLGVVLTYAQEHECDGTITDVVTQCDALSCQMEAAIHIAERMAKAEREEGSAGV